MSRPSIPDHYSDPLRNHIQRYLETDGVEGHMWDSSVVGGLGPVPTLLLTTVGRRSGNPQLLPLIYGETGIGYIVVASKGGAPAHPAWYLNLSARPEVEVQVAARRFRAKARTATEPERSALWAKMVEIYPPYTEYAQRTEREIPVVVLDPSD